MGAVQMLMIEDNLGDVFLTKTCLQDCCVPIEFHVANDGEKALEWLRDSGVQPDMVLLDWNLPKLSGHEVLEHFRSNEANRLTPVLVFSSSQNPEDVKLAYRNGANGFITKPSQFDEFTRAVQQICYEWVKPLAAAAGTA